MRNVNYKFYIANNNNTYFATSYKAMTSFCKKHNLVVTYWYTYLPFTEEREAAIRCGRGIYCINDDN
jgi:hypothetical protein